PPTTVASFRLHAACGIARGMTDAAEPIPFHVPFATGREADYVAEAVLGGRLAAGGPFARRCEELLQARYGVGRVFLTNSCTAALEAAALVLGCGPGDEVIVPSWTFTSTAAAFARAGAQVVFADV